MNVNLIVFKPDGTRKDIPLRDGTYVVGRQSTATLRIPLPSVSRQHCELVVEGPRVSVRDLGSSNGTYRNQERVTQAVLEAGDQLMIGACVMTLQIGGKPANVRPPGMVSEGDPMAETPPAGSKAAASADAADTVHKAAPMSPPRAGNKPDDSSIFDFDFDFEDDENPKL